MFLPTLYGEGDASEKPLHDIAGQIPGVDIVYTGRTADQMLGQLKRLKTQGKKVDLLVIAGHVRQYESGRFETPKIAGIAIDTRDRDRKQETERLDQEIGDHEIEIARVKGLIKYEQSLPNWKRDMARLNKYKNDLADLKRRIKKKEQRKETLRWKDVLTPDRVDAKDLLENITKRCNHPNINDPNNPAMARSRKQLKKDCAKLKEWQDLSSVMTPGAEIIVLSCYTGYDQEGYNFLTKLGTALLWENGGTIIGPKTAAAVETASEGAIDWISHIAKRTRQSDASFFAGKELKPGDAFVSAGGWTRINIDPQTIPACCTPKSQSQIVWIPKIVDIKRYSRSRHSSAHMEINEKEKYIKCTESNTRTFRLRGNTTVLRWSVPDSVPYGQDSSVKMSISGNGPTMYANATAPSRLDIVGGTVSEQMRKNRPSSRVYPMPLPSTEIVDEVAAINAPGRTTNWRCSCIPGDSVRLRVVWKLGREVEDDGPGFAIAGGGLGSYSDKTSSSAPTSSSAQTASSAPTSSSIQTASAAPASSSAPTSGTVVSADAYQAAPNRRSSATSSTIGTGSLTGKWNAVNQYGKTLQEIEQGPDGQLTFFMPMNKITGAPADSNKKLWISRGTVKNGVFSYQQHMYSVTSSRTIQELPNKTGTARMKKINNNRFQMTVTSGSGTGMSVTYERIN